jgi:transcriptional regulator with XRE-family HTH domain
MLQKVLQFLSEYVTMDTFGEWLRRQRTVRGLTREEFAKRVGCSVAMLRKIEDGERRPSTQIAELIANCLDVPLEQRSTFVRVARGELGMGRLLLESNPVVTGHDLSPKTNLPIFPTPLIGRERELKELGLLLRDPQCRLLTLVGPGGIGKTRLAIETSSSMQDVFDHGVYFVPLASVGSINAVISTMANAIHFVFYGPSDPKVQFLNYLKEKRVLLVVDNVEHLLVGEPGLETVAELMGEILDQAAQVKLLTVSLQTVACRIHPWSCSCSAPGERMWPITSPSRITPLSCISANWWMECPSVSSWLRPGSALYPVTRSQSRSNVGWIS